VHAVCVLAGQRPGHGAALGCAGRTRTCACVLVRGTRRIHPIAGGALDATGVARHGAPRWFLQVNMLGSKPGSHTTIILRGEGEFEGKGCPKALARRGGHPCSSAGRRPSLERAMACAGHSHA
jgi:hypothetical protein